MNTPVLVFDLSRGEYGPTYVGVSAQRAVINAYAQDRGDFNTWDYEDRYGDLVVEAEHTVRCGDFSAFKRTKVTVA